MKTFVSISFVVFYLFGTLMLPFSDFSIIKELPAMYKHCKATEDTDLNVLEFVFEHVSGIGQLVEGIEHDFEAEENGDKPHAPIQFSSEQQQLICFHQNIKLPAVKPIPLLSVNFVSSDNTYISDYISNIFRPPVV